MNERLLNCAFCGLHFNPQDRNACPGCPLNKGCQLVCCPACGFETIDVERSHLARLVSDLFSRHRKNDSTPQQTNHKLNREP